MNELKNDKITASKKFIPKSRARLYIEARTEGMFKYQDFEEQILCLIKGSGYGKVDTKELAFILTLIMDDIEKL